METVYHGPGLFTLLTVLFIGLKLTGHIAWSWWWVLSPTLIPIGIIGVIGLALGITASGTTIHGR